ncbi:MAG: type II toxin-antitoxin system RelB/DinJ family antitoxin [Evtepia sp.]
MAKTSNLNIRIDPSIKEQVEQLFSNFGMNVTDAVNIFLHQSLIYGGLPFEVKIDKPNAETIQAMENVKNGIGLSKAFTSVEDLMEDLSADD